jgi:hypothetical protein
MSECNLQNELKLISKEMNIPEDSTITTCLGEASYVRLIKHPIVIHNEGSCASVQVGVHVGSTSTIDPNISAVAVELLEKLERQEEFGDFEDLLELSFIILESGEYRLYVNTDNYTSYYDFEDITMFDYVLKNKLHEAE